TDERRTCNKDAVQALLISICLVLLLFGFGFRELGRPSLVLISLAMGMCWTAGYTTLAVGHLNFLTVTFLSMLTGLGADFGIHILARYAEERDRGAPPLEAVQRTMRRTGQVTWIGALVTSAGFWTLKFSHFQAVAELGVIAGGGILLCFLALTTVLWSFLALLESRCSQTRFRPPGARELVYLEGYLLDYPRPVVTAFAVLTAGALLLCPKVHFDFNLLKLQDPNLPSIQNEMEMARSGNSFVLYAVSIAATPEEARRRIARFEELPGVSRVESVLPLLPVDPEGKLPVVRQLVSLAREVPTVDMEPIRGAEGLTRLQNVIAQVDVEFSFLVPRLAASSDPEVGDGARDLQRLWLMLDETANRVGPGVVESALDVFQEASTQDMERRLNLLRMQKPRAPDLGQVPGPLKARTIGSSGRYILRVFPRENPWSRPCLERFVRDLKTVDPDINGDPTLAWHFNYLIEHTYKTVGWYTYLAVFLVLLAYFRSPLKAALTLLPITVSLIWMVGLMALWGMNFNPANFIALPMLVGIGASFGIQVV
ncbi:MAG: MMPL family transporter, partial [Candidatus Eremiobacterota bacterium]